MPNFVASWTWSRRPRIARPTSSSLVCGPGAWGGKPLGGGGEVRGEDADRHPGAAHPLQEEDAVEVGLGVAAPPASVTGDGVEQPGALVVAQGVGGEAAVAGRLGDRE